MGLLERAAEDNIATIREIESRYLSAINTGNFDDLIDEEEFTGDGDE